MTSFAGFPVGKTRFTPIPDLFFSELLPAIDDLAELKVTLYMFWLLHRQRGYPRYMTMDELESEGVLLSALRGIQAEPRDALHRAVSLAVARGVLLQLDIVESGAQSSEAESARSTDTKDVARRYLFLNTPQGRKAMAEVRRGELVLEREGSVREAHTAEPRLNIFQLYEQNVGLLQPLLAEELEEAARDFPATWIEQAFKIAVGRNVRHWRYIRSILDRWEREGKDKGLETN